MNEWWAALHFLRPHWLWLLLAIPIIYLSFHIGDDIRPRWKRYIDPELLDHLIVARKRHWRFRPIHMVCLLILLGTLAIAGPTWKREQAPFTEDKAPLVIALDLSQTMDAIDLDPTRLERAKLKLRDLLKVRDGGRTALFVYSGTAHMVLPFTTDFSLFDLYLSSLSTSLMPVNGKDTGGVLHSIQDLLKDEPVPGTILFVTDGIEPQALSAFRQFAAQNEDQNDILVMGVGTSAGGPVRVSANEFLSDRMGRRVYSKLDVNALRSLSQIGIAATTLTMNDDDIRWIQRRVQHHLQAVQQRDSKTRWIDEGYWLTIPIAAIAFFWFRKGWTVRWTSAALAVVFALPPSGDQAGFSWMDLWLTRDQQGRYYFEKGDYRKAAEKFEDPLWKGVALSSTGDYEGALNVFALSDSAEAWYNQGDALAHLGKYPEARLAYQQALARRHPWPEAKENLALVESLIPKAKHKDKEQEEEAPNLPPDQMKFDEKGQQGKKTQVRIKLDPNKMAEIWMRNVQTTPADFLRRRFAVQAAEERHP
jgi:Ca-activated chloride channel family protein